MSENNLTALTRWHTEAWWLLHSHQNPPKKQSSEMQARKHIQRIP